MGVSRPIGIDLGTSYSCAARVEDGKPRVIQSRLGYATLPSVVTFDDRGDPVVGHAAERRMILQPEHTIYGAKRLLGRTYLSGVIERFQPRFQYPLVRDNEGFVAAQVCGRTVPIVDVSALVLHEIKLAAERGLGEEVLQAVVTVPAYFNENQRALVREAGHRAGLDVIRVINEPTAAALAFGFNRGEHQRVLVFDLGGGTFDVSIVEIDSNVFEVIGTDGDTFLGGVDFDRRLVEQVVERTSQRLGRAVALTPVGRERVRVAAQEAKHQLSAAPRTLLAASGVVLADGTIVDVAEELTVQDLESLTRDLVDRTIETVQRALDRAHLRPSDIDEVLLVGGQTRMPIVQRRLANFMLRDLNRRVHPDEAVAMGAAIAADAHGHRDAAVLHDVVPIPIGIADADGLFYVVVPRNTPVPTEARTTVIVPAGLKTLKLTVYQGDQSHVIDNEYLGSLVVEGLAAVDQTLSCELVFALDVECMLKVTAKIAQLGIDREVALATRQTPDEVLADMGRERIRVIAAEQSPAQRLARRRAFAPQPVGRTQTPLPMPVLGGIRAVTAPLPVTAPTPARVPRPQVAAQNRPQLAAALRPKRYASPPLQSWFGRFWNWFWGI